MSRADPQASGCLPLRLFRENKECLVNTHRPPPPPPCLRISDDEDGVLERDHGWVSTGELAQLGQAHGRFCTLQRRRFAFGLPKAETKGKVAGSQIESNSLILQFCSRSRGPDWRSQEATWATTESPVGTQPPGATDSRWQGRDGRKSGFIQAIMNMSPNLFFF